MLVLATGAPPPNRRSWRSGSDSGEQVQPRLVLFDAKGGAISGKLALHDGSIVGPAVGIVGQHDDAVARRRAPDDEVVGIVIQSPLPPIERGTEFYSPTCTPGELVVDAPERFPSHIVEPENVCQKTPVVGGRGQERSVAMEAGLRISQMALLHAKWPEEPVTCKRGDRHTAAQLRVGLEQDETLA